MAIPATMYRPFRRDEFLWIPPEWRVGPPDWVGVGCGKAGSSWWYSLVVSHPRVVQNRLRRKELHYFPHLGWHRPTPGQLAVYREAFARPRGAVCGEWSPEYLYFPFALEALAEAAPDARLVAILRNPVDRFVSCLNQYSSVRTEVVGATGDGRRALETWSLFPEAAYQCRVADGLERAIRLFGRDGLLVLQYETCVAHPERELARTFEFLGVDPSHRPPQLTRPVNARPYRLERPDAAHRARIAAWFEDDVRRTKDLLPELELERWGDFPARGTPALEPPPALPSPRAPRVPWPLRTAATTRVFAWPRFDDPGELDLLLRHVGADLAGRADACLCLRRDPNADASPGEVAEALRAAHARVLGPDTALEVLLIDEPMAAGDWERLGLAVDAVALLPSSETGPRAEAVARMGATAARRVAPPRAPAG